ncbi:hypothetical protein GUITHDRAFT_142937 [Guillardia theta CCMP2712]|uniref:Elongator complex protein 4 n=1 Tax=Guillardia theta (strain CCMP2712) TaxID=905079 RepID=L1IWG2_GUITC|nr:hypothetical protein GUITHDRAFT_142937 [Guillardia theta CCMP2712]EKX40214.1 hypothetical protein GUITHDRAFT_142937 [Guillardia theta CCMP2712]|eukprot:XP_005827194.1 hypothetical protein GUITHDRAFT_142937 [Guillardia theta CCMP2712]
MASSVFRRYEKEPGAASSTSSQQEKAELDYKHVKGVKSSAFSKNWQTSSGLAAIDSALGGGITVGTVLLVVEDSPTRCYEHIFKHCIAQGVQHEHNVLLCGEGGRISDEIPSLIENEKDDELRIAWRYKEAIQQQSKLKTQTSGPSYCDRFDISKSKPLSPEIREKFYKELPITREANGESQETESSQSHFHLSHLLDQIKNAVKLEEKLCRVMIPSLGSLSWFSPGRPRQSCENDLLVFVKMLKGMVRRSRAVVVMSVPPWLAQTDAGSRLMRISDYILHLDSLAACDATVRQQYKDYVAFAHLRKVLLLHWPSTSLISRCLQTIQFDRMHAANPEEVSSSKPSGQVAGGLEVF